jgi:hypothetical protein
MTNDNHTRVVRVGFINFFKLSLLFGLALGQLGGMTCLICAICTSGVTVDLGFWKTQGALAGVICWFLVPLMMGLGATLFAPVLYPPFALACRTLGGFKVCEK